MTSQEKSVEDYRNIINILKERLKDKQVQYQQAKNLYSTHNVFEDTSYDSTLREKILEGTKKFYAVEIEQLNKEERKHMKHKASHIYALHFAMLKLQKVCEVLQVTPEMLFRGLDRRMEQGVGVAEFSQGLRETFSKARLS